MDSNEEHENHTSDEEDSNYFPSDNSGEDEVSANEADDNEEDDDGTSNDHPGWMIVDVVGRSIPEEEVEEEDGGSDEQDTGSADFEAFTEPLSMHSLMVPDMVSVRGHTLLFEKEQYKNIPVLYKGIVLLPEQYLPLVTAHPELQMVLKQALQKDKIFGVRFNSKDRIGTIAQILRYKEFKNSYPGAPDELKVYAKGTGRFKVRSCKPRSSFYEWSTIEVLPEIKLPCLNYNKWVHDEERCLACVKQKDISEHTWIGRSVAGKKHFLLTSFYKQPLTVWPEFVYRLYDVNELVERIRVLLSNLVPDLKGKIPSDPTILSFWVAQNFPFGDTHKLAFLKMNSAIQRLRAEIFAIREYNTLICGNCNEIIASLKDVFCMAAEGPSGTYVNVHGFIHETLTVYSAKGTVVSLPSVEHSWFPGWAWSIMNCSSCRRHLGWKFSATRRNLKPKKFWGLTRHSLGIKQSNGSSETFELVF